MTWRRTEETPAQYTALAKQLGALKLAYIHIVAYAKVGEPLIRAIRSGFGGAIIINGGLDKAKLETAIGSGLADLGAFGTGFLANPDLPNRLKNSLALNPLRRIFSTRPKRPVTRTTRRPGSASDAR